MGTAPSPHPSRQPWVGVGEGWHHLTEFFGLKANLLWSSIKYDWWMVVNNKNCGGKCRGWYYARICMSIHDLQGFSKKSPSQLPQPSLLQLILIIEESRLYMFDQCVFLMVEWGCRTNPSLCDKSTFFYMYPIKWCLRLRLRIHELDSLTLTVK